MAFSGCWAGRVAFMALIYLGDAGVLLVPIVIGKIVRDMRAHLRERLKNKTEVLMIAAMSLIFLVV